MCIRKKNSLSVDCTATSGICVYLFFFLKLLNIKMHIIIQGFTIYIYIWQLRSSISQQLIVPKTKHNLVKRAFSVAVPRVWNELPVTLKTSETIAILLCLKAQVPEDIGAIEVNYIYIYII